MIKRLLLLTAIAAISGPAMAQQSGRIAVSPGGEPPMAATTVNINAGSGKLSLCFWGSSAYSPGSHVDYFETTKKANACFHCNDNGTWDTPCQ